MSWIWRS